MTTTTTMHIQPTGPVYIIFLRSKHKFERDQPLLTNLKGICNKSLYNFSNSATSVSVCSHADLNEINIKRNK